jgi:hypothetical protein
MENKLSSSAFDEIQAVTLHLKQRAFVTALLAFGGAAALLATAFVRNPKASGVWVGLTVAIASAASSVILKLRQRAAEEKIIVRAVTKTSPMRMSNDAVQEVSTMPAEAQKLVLEFLERLSADPSQAVITAHRAPNSNTYLNRLPDNYRLLWTFEKSGEPQSTNASSLPPVLVLDVVGPQGHADMIEGPREQVV